MASPDINEPEKMDDDSKNYPAQNMSSDWRFSDSNLTNTSMRLIPAESPVAAGKGDMMEPSLCSSASMVDSFCPNIWDQTTSSQNMGFCDISVQHNAGSSSTLGFGKGNLGPLRNDLGRALDMGWAPPNSMLKGGMLLPSPSRMLPQSLSQFPTDTGFIERAARFSCFGGGNYGDMVNAFIIPESMSPYSRVAAPMQGHQELYGSIRMSSVSGGQSLDHEIGMVDGSKDASMPIEHGGNGTSPPNSERNSDVPMKSHDEAKQSFHESGNDSDEPISSGGGQAEPSILEGTVAGTSARGHGLKKRKRVGQKDSEPDQVKATSIPPEAIKQNSEIQHRGEPNPPSTTNRPGGKHGKQGSQASEPPKEEYIHVRARRGQATNSHSLAERVRREKISERMKFLQDLVPGCSKVTGKAVMLDEIINYVQSLQRQVEFLSMKLATVNPRLDFNIEGLLAKDILQSRAGPSSVLGFHPDISLPYAELHPSQPGGIQAGLPGIGNSSDGLRRSISSHLTAMGGGYKESTSQVPNVWEDELHNIVQMGLNSSIPLDGEDLDGSLPSGHVKAEL